MDKVTVYEDAVSQWRWRRQSENGEIVSTSGEGYVNKDHAVRMAHDLNDQRECTFVVEEP